MATYEYSFVLSIGVTVESDEPIDWNEEGGYRKLRELATYQLEQDSIEHIVNHADFGDIDETEV
jgi:hypothetical protein